MLLEKPLDVKHESASDNTCAIYGVDAHPSYQLFATAGGVAVNRIFERRRDMASSSCAMSKRDMLLPPLQVRVKREDERALLLQHAQHSSYNSVVSCASDAPVGITIIADPASDNAAVPHDRKHRSEDVAALPKWFVTLVCASVALTLTWIGGLVFLQHSGQRVDVSAYVSVDTAHSLYLYAGVLNSLLGSFLSASGYCCQKYAHLRVQHAPALGAATQQRAFRLGLLLLAVGTLSAVLNLGLLGQAVQAPFAALTLIYSAALGHVVLHEPLNATDVLASGLIVVGVVGDVFAAQLAHIPQPSYTLRSLAQLFFRDSVVPATYALVALAFVTTTLRTYRPIRTQRHQRSAIALLTLSASAGVMAGFTSLATKSVVEVAKSTLRRGRWAVVLHPFLWLLVAAIPAALALQLYLLNAGLAAFGTLEFVPLYQAFVILGNLMCGLVFFNELANYSAAAALGLVAGVASTLAGVALLLVKAERSAQASSQGGVADRLLVQTPTRSTTDDDCERFATAFTFEEMRFATDDDDVTPLQDVDACKRAIVELLRSATTTVYYSTFLCDWTLALADSDGDNASPSPVTMLSLVRAAVARGVRVHVLYNPVGDYGTATVATLQQLLPPQVELACRVSDLGPSALTQCCSRNAKYAFQHQKYLCVDGAKLLVTGCDVNTERAGWLELNARGYFWHELGVVTRCSDRMRTWIEHNHAASTTAPQSITKLIAAVPFPLVAGGAREEHAMVNLILHATHSVQLENQLLVSGGALQRNRVVDALVLRIARAHAAGSSFDALVLTNAGQPDEPSCVTRLYCAVAVQWSLEQLEARAAERGLSPTQLATYLVVARLECDGVAIKVHSNVLIVDGVYALRSSSNLADRSLSARPTDTELGLLFAGARTVGALQHELLSMYLSGDASESQQQSQLTVADALDCVRTGRSGCIVPLARASWTAVVPTSWLMRVFINCSGGATGGRYKVSYTTSVVPRQQPLPLSPKHHSDSDSSQGLDSSSVAAVAC